MVIFGGGGKSADGTWAQRVTKATATMEKGRSLGRPLALKASNLSKKAKSFSQPISTHSHECKDPSCRQPIKISLKLQASGKQDINMNHECLATKKMKSGLSNHLCSTCHKLGLDCRDKVWRGLRCATNKPVCAHLHDGSGKPRKLILCDIPWYSHCVDGLRPANAVIGP